MEYLFANHLLDTERRELRRGPRPVAVQPQVFDLLVYLVKNRDRVVSKDDLIASVWGGRIVSDSTLTTRINAARRAVGDSGEKQELIRTIARKGLRFVGAVHIQLEGEGAHAPGPAGKELRDLMPCPRSLEASGTKEMVGARSTFAPSHAIAAIGGHPKRSTIENRLADSGRSWTNAD